MAHRRKDEPSLGRFLCYGSDVIDTVEEGLAILRDAVEHGRWPADEG